MYPSLKGSKSLHIITCQKHTLVPETMAMKVMVAGDVEGNLTTLFKRVEAVDKKAGNIANDYDL